MTAPAVVSRLAAVDPADDAKMVETVRALLGEVREHLLRLHREKRSGRTTNRANSDLVDMLMSGLFSHAEEAQHRLEGGDGSDGGPLALAAVGGYGRRALCVHSDIDLLLLHRGAMDERVRGVAERLQRWLWDAGLTVGSATRTVEETVRLADEDVTVRTAALDARLLAGDPALVAELEVALRTRLEGRPGVFLAEQVALLIERHETFGESLYLLQPNVKEGAGGLRDYHAAYWVARVACPDVRRMEDLGREILTPAEMVQLDEALDFLYLVRNELHFQAGRRQDQMGFEAQERVAEQLGFAPREGELPVEHFMQTYYRHARVIQNLSELIIEVCARRLRGPTERREEIVEEDFRLAEGHLEIPDAEHLRARPLRLLLAFEVAQRHGVPLSRRAQRLIRENLDAIDDGYRRDPEARDCLDRILNARERVMRTLVAMNEVGVLAAYLPEWDHIVCRWQHVIYHTYTVDVHSIFLVEELRRLWRGKYERALPELTDRMRAVEDRSVLFLGCLLHDIGKGRGGDHSRVGTELARACLDRMGMAPERRDRVLFLVEHHLLMSHLAQRRDLSDPKLIVDFARTVRDRPNLRNLYLLTFADIRASSRAAWSDWKGQLLWELFERTAEFLETGGDDPQRAIEQVEARVEARRAEARRELVGLGVAESRIAAYFDILPRRYFIAHTPKQIARHAMVMLPFDPARKLATRVRSMPGDFSELIVVAPDVHGLYARVAGTLTAQWLNILGSHVYTTSTGLALEIYRVATPPGTPEQRREVWRSFEETLRRVLDGEIDVDGLLARRRKPLGTARSPSQLPTVVDVSNAESDFYTIVDVSANDRLGLLYDLGSTIAEHGFEIYISKASTILDQVADTFYLKDLDGKKILDPKRLEALRQALLAVAEAAGPGDG